jgi:hypothetical protein
MPQRSKGDRKAVKTLAPTEIIPELQRRAEQEGCTSISQYVADLLCMEVGRPDLVRELGRREELPLTA